MSASTGDLLTLVNGHDPVAVVFYRDDQAREDLLEQCELLVRNGTVRRTASVYDAFRSDLQGEVLLLVPENEAEAVRCLDSRREKLIERTSPTVVFLLQGGSAEEVLRTEAFAISSFLRGLTYDPEPDTTPLLEERREAFKNKHELSPDEWLEAWRSGDTADTAANNLTAHEAWSLRTP